MEAHRRLRAVVLRPFLPIGLQGVVEVQHRQLRFPERDVRPLVSFLNSLPSDAELAKARCGVVMHLVASSPLRAGCLRPKDHVGEVWLLIPDDGFAALGEVRVEGLLMH